MAKEYPANELRDAVISVTGLENVYIDPPASVKLKFPCIVITRSSGYTEFADNHPYLHTRSYEIQLIDNDPDSQYYDKLVFGFPMIRVNRHFVSDGKHHDNFILYY